MILEIREASWSAPVLWRFASRQYARQIQHELFASTTVQESPVRNGKVFTRYGLADLTGAA